MVSRNKSIPKPSQITNSVVGARTRPKKGVTFTSGSGLDESGDNMMGLAYRSDEIGASFTCSTVTPTRETTTEHHTIGGGGIGGRGGQSNGQSRHRAQQPRDKTKTRERYEFTIGFNPKTTKHSTGSQIVWKACNKIFAKT